MGSTSIERIKFAVKVLAQRYSVKGIDVPTPAENQRLESRPRAEICWVCLRHHEHRWHWSAWLCMRLFGDPRNTYKIRFVRKSSSLIPARLIGLVRVRGHVRDC